MAAFRTPGITSLRLIFAIIASTSSLA